MNDAGVVTTERSGYTIRGLVPVLAIVSVCGVVLFGVTREAEAMSVDGTLVTNIVSATYHSIAGQHGSANPWAPEYRTSYLASAYVMVSCPMLVVLKEATPTTDSPLWWWDAYYPHAWGSPGGLVTFRICTINTSQQASAFNVVLTDRYDQNVMWDDTAFPPDGWTGWITGSIGPSLNIGWSADNIAYNSKAPVPAGQAGPFYLRWTIDILGPGRSACVTYALEVK